jgi:chromosome segregation ATPase
MVKGITALLTIVFLVSTSAWAETHEERIARLEVALKQAQERRAAADARVKRAEAEGERLRPQLEAALAEAQRAIVRMDAGRIEEENRKVREQNRELQAKLDPPTTRPADQPERAQAPTYAESAAENERLRSEVQRLKAELGGKPASSASAGPATYPTLEAMMRRRRLEMMRDGARFAPPAKPELVSSASPATTQPTSLEEMMRRRRAEWLAETKPAPQ